MSVRAAQMGSGRRARRPELAGGAGYEEKLRLHGTRLRNRFHGLNPPGHGRAASSGSAPRFAAFSERGAPVRSSGTGKPAARPSQPEAELAPRIDFLNPPGETTFRRVGVGVELENEG